ncbi:MAG TPA: HPr(Ser) kinase/phosphatase [Polyangiaceae bacterium]|nr:HPr(Ser) kinase/phosphatase [Polyangiaceae bacterium]
MSTRPGAPATPPGVTVRELLEDRRLGLTLFVAAGRAGLERRIAHPRIQKSGLVFVGHTHGLVPERVQILGETEVSYIDSLSPEQQAKAAGHIFSLAPGLVLVTRGVTLPQPFLDAAEATSSTVVVCAEDTSQAINALHTLLDERLAPRTRIHGVLVDVFEVGVLLLGKSGIGKSECGLDLVQRGHRLVADDVVECDVRPPGMVFGEPAPLLRHHIEVRGLGILDIKELFGITAIRERKRIDLVVQLEEGAADPSDRLGLEGRTREILGIPVREVLLIVRPGRNTSSIIEMAARNELLRGTGKDTSLDMVNRVDRALVRKPNESGAMQAVVPLIPGRPMHVRHPEPVRGAFESYVPRAPDPKDRR